MKKLVLFLILIIAPCYALDYSYFCSDSAPLKTASGVFMSTSGTNFVARKIAQMEIARALKKETDSKFNVKLYSFWGTNIAQGEFNKFTAKSKNYYHDNLSAEKLTVETVCPYNKISYLNNKLNFDSNMVLKYDAEINKNNLSQMLRQNVDIIDNKIAFDYKISAFGIKAKLNIKAGLAVEDNEIKLCDIQINNKSISASKYSYLLDNLTNFKINLNKGTKADLMVDNVVIKDSKIYLSGFVLIPKS